MSDYKDMSDFEINLAVAKKLWLVVSAESHGHNAVEARCDDGYHAWFTIDYCNNWADIGPIIVDNRITITPYQDESQGWFATTDTSFFVDDINPLRAAAIVFLMMQESK